MSTHCRKNKPDTILTIRFFFPKFIFHLRLVLKNNVNFKIVNYEARADKKKLIFYKQSAFTRLLERRKQIDNTNLVNR